MLFIYYKLPSDAGEDVLVMEGPFFESSLALLFTKSDENLPRFYMAAYEEGVTVEDAVEDEEPYYVTSVDGFEGVLPARNKAEAAEWARIFYAKIKQHQEFEAAR